MSLVPPHQLLHALRDALKASMAARDRVAVDVLRVAIAAVENLEAQPLDGREGHQPSAIEDAPASADVARRVVTDAEARAVVEGEVAELDVAVTDYDRLDRADAATRARRQAEVLRSVLASVAAPD